MESITYIVSIVDMDDVQPYFTLGPFDTEEAAIEDGESMVEFLSDETLPGHAHPHEWSCFVTALQTYNEAITEFDRDNEAEGQEPWNK